MGAGIPGAAEDRYGFCLIQQSGECIDFALRRSEQRLDPNHRQGTEGLEAPGDASFVAQERCYGSENEKESS